MRNRRGRYMIGIDPGTKTGVATNDTTRVNKLIDLRTLGFWKTYFYVCETFKPLEVQLVRIEVSPDSKVWHDSGMKNVRTAAKVGQNVGAVRIQGELLAEGLRDFGFNVQIVAPLGTKHINADRFARLTGWTARSNEHERDAAMLIHGI